MSGYTNSARPERIWCDRCSSYHEHWEHFDEFMWFVYLKIGYRMNEAFEKYLEEKVMEKWLHE